MSLRSFVSLPYVLVHAGPVIKNSITNLTWELPLVMNSLDMCHQVSLSSKCLPAFLTRVDLIRNRVLLLHMPKEGTPTLEDNIAVIAS